MIERAQTLLWLFFWLIFIGIWETVFSQNDITAVKEFGCRWSGGSLESGVTCICHASAGEFFIEKGSIPSYDAIILKIDSCNSVRFGINAINDMRNLRNIELSNINNLYFDESSLLWNSYIQSNNDQHNSWDGTPTLKISIEKSNIRQISSYTFQGKIRSIVFRDSFVENIAPFAFSSLMYTESIHFINVDFNNIQTQAFKKFSVDYLALRESTFNVIPSRSFLDVTVVHTFQIRNCSFNSIKPAGFLIRNPKRFEIVHSEINALDGEGFKVMTRGSVEIKNNTFNVTSSGAFIGISLNKEEVNTPEKIIFDSDTFNSLEKRSLEINSTSFSVQYYNIFINQECNCRFTNYALEDSEFQCLFDEEKRITLKEFKDNNCSVLMGYSTIIIVLGIVVVLFIIIFSSLLFYFKCVQKKHSEYITDKNGKQISLIMPDGRTYRETELHVVVERADLLTTDL